MQPIEMILRYYPRLYQLALVRRQNILHQYRQSAFTGGRRQGWYSDPTAAKVIRLTETDMLIKTLSIVRQWIDSKLSIDDRRLLLDVWRFNTWNKLSQKYDGVMIRWGMMIANLKAFAGHVYGVDGAAFALGRTLNLLEL